MHNLDSCLHASATHHDRLCPRQVLGARMGLLAGRLLGLELPRQDKRLIVFFETDGCSLDGVIAATGCTPGHRTLRIEDYGKLAGTFVDADTGKAIRLVPHPQARSRAGAFASEGRTRWQAQLIGYQRLRDEDLFLAQRVALIAPLESLISHPGARARCGRCGEEILNERQVSFGGSIACRACAGEAYYRELSGESARRELLDQRDVPLDLSPLDANAGALVEAAGFALPAPGGAGQA